MTVAELRQNRVESDEQLFVLKDRDGDFVESVQGTGMETVKIHFTFTKVLENARVFTDQDLHWKQAVNPDRCDVHLWFCRRSLYSVAKTIRVRIC